MSIRRFREGDISLEDKPRMGRPHATDIETLLFLVMDAHNNLRVKCQTDLDYPKMRSTEIYTSFTLLTNAQDKIPTT
ncbi:hypothetical protein LAZ67_14001605 [Cordylochernes scorpioides]|uniref:Uncharacterized protein n=1 Tax=Cordylochernes scorpioides TaxID=51811 RepID=A0ABY6L7A1_9ARAC|nr:hypothetical protein LAZ67_14001605 [Cordylochernes scorpioides]